MSNRVGFASDHPKRNERRSSAAWPFQRFNWTDHAADLGDTIAYRVTARVGTPGALSDGPASAWTHPITLTTDCDGSHAAFNRGFVISQYISRVMRDKGWTAAELKAQLGTIENDVRRFLSGNLRPLLLGLLDEARTTPGIKAYAALYELEDDELEQALIACGNSVELVLANGSVDAVGDDQNSAARAKLKGAGLRVHDRMVSPNALGHNKVLVLAHETAAGPQPFKVLTGSTNWTRTGLCTQVNNAVVVDNADVAKAYFDHWVRLRNAGSAKPSSLAAANPSPTGPIALGNGARATVWMTAVKAEADITALKALVNSAQEGILFTMFNAGSEPLKTILARQQAGLYVRGVVNQIGKDERESIKLVKDGLGKRFFLDIVEPEGVSAPLASWAEEVTRNEFIGQVGYAMTHSKCIVIDPFGARPIVITGSHNFSKSASGKNDDNFIVIEGNRKLAEAYAVNCMMTYQHYRWRRYLQEARAKHVSPFEYLSPDPGWQSRLASAATKADLDFWL